MHVDTIVTDSLETISGTLLKVPTGWKWTVQRTKVGGPQGIKVNVPNRLNVDGSGPCMGGQKKWKWVVLKCAGGETGMEVDGPKQFVVDPKGVKEDGLNQRSENGWSKLGLG